MARAIWTGSLSFGMVTFPVRVFGATEARDINFHLLHKDCGARLKQVRVCPVHEREVEWREVVRGYEYTKDEHVVLTEEDFERLPLASRHSVAVSAFVKEAEVDPIFYERTYYLEPAGAGTKPYALLAQALERRQLVAIGTITLRRKEQLCAVRAQRGRLALETLYYADEVRARETEDSADVKLTEKELEMADTLIGLLSARFDPAQYHDRYREALAELIEAKLAGRTPGKAPARPGGSRVLDLTEALRRSVAQARQGKPAPRAARQPTRKRAARRRKVG